MTVPKSDYPRGSVYLWVEDAATREALEIFLRDKRISLHIARSKSAVHNLVRATAAGDAKIVYGVVDRDFDPPGNDWNHCDRLFVWPVHELENLLLDEEVLAELAQARVIDIGRALKQAAEAMRWEVACSAVLRRIDRDLRDGFPGDPPRSQVRTREEARSFLVGNSHWTALATRAAKFQQGGAIDRMLDEIDAQATADLAGDQWKARFPGKELLRSLRAAFPRLQGPAGATPDNRDLDLVKQVAREMRRRERTPSDIVELRRILRARSGLDSMTG